MTKHPHYHKDVSHLKTIDVYRTLELFGVTDQALGHAIKKLLCAGQRGAGKTFEQDVREAVDTLNRRLQMLAEDDNPRMPALSRERPTWATHMVLDGFNETHYVQACAERPGSYVSLTDEGDVAHIFTHHSIVQVNPLPAKEAQGFSNGEGAPICATHWGTTFRLWIAQDTNGGYSEYRQDGWFPVPENRAKSDWNLGLQPILR